MSELDPYKILQVDSEAEEEVIEAAYKRLARKYHPDVSPDPDSVERMVSINQAWEMLRDPIRRAAVDRARTRNAATTARVVAADGKAQASARAHQAPSGPTSPASSQPPSTPPPPSAPNAPRGASPGWPFPGMQEPGSGPSGPDGEPVASNWTPGRSTQGSHYDTRSMGVGSAGAPPGNPSGSIVTFGRYEGWTLGEIARTDLEYLEWLDRMPIGRTYQAEIDVLLRKHGRRTAAPSREDKGRGLFRRR